MMYRRNGHNIFKHLDFILLDILALFLSYLTAYIIRFGSLSGISKDSFYLGKLLILVLASFADVAVTGNYKNILRRGYAKELRKVIIHVSFVMAIVVLFSFAVKETIFFSRLFVGMFYIFGILLVYVERILWKKKLLKKNPLREVKNYLLVSSEEKATRLLDEFSSHGYTDFRIVAAAINDTRDSQIQGIPVVANDQDEVLQYIIANPLDGVVFYGRLESVSGLIRNCEIMGITVHIVLHHRDNLLGEVDVEEIGGVSIITSCVKLVNSDELIWKRVVDIIGAAVGLIITGIAMIFVAPLVYISDPGPIIFKQKRIGEGGKVFDCYKIRSMYTDAEERKKELLAKNQMQGHMFKMDNDPRIIGSGEDGTKKGIGWFIRTFSIDELPQFWNVMKGDMSLVGTRPPTVDEWESYEPHHRIRMRVRPGITGLWQVSGRNEITDFEEVVKLDQEYIKNWTLGLDFRIILKTIAVVIRRKGSK